MSLFSRSKDKAEAAYPHETLDPRWDSMTDAGREECIDHPVCRRRRHARVEAPDDDRAA